MSKASGSKHGKKRKVALGEEKGDDIVVGKRSKAKMKAAKALRKENKFFDTVLGSVEVNYDNVLAQGLNIPVQGDTVNSRDGNKIMVTGVQIKGLIYWQPNVAVTPCVMRMLLVYDKRPNLGGANAIGGVLTTSGAATDVYQLRNRATGLTERFRVLKDVMLDQQKETNYYSGTDNRTTFDWFIPVKALTVFGANAGAAADVQQGLIVMYAFSNIPQAALGPQIEYRARVSFEEI